VVIIVSVVLLYQTTRVKEQTASNIQDLVDQVNESASYAYKFDISQEDNIKTMEKNINLINENINNIGKNVKIMQENMNAPPKPAYTENVKTGILSLGDRFTLMRIPDNDSDSDWLGILDADKSSLYGGLALSQAYVDDTLGVMGSLYVGGAKSTHNPDKLPTIFAYEDKNYVRGDTDVDGELKVEGVVKTDDKFCIKDTCITEKDLKAVISSFGVR
jgi:uncharacterized protein YlaN (UPF0358 family)